VGHEARVKVAEPIDGRRNFAGVIVSAGEEAFTLKLLEGGVDMELPFGSVARANLREDI
jgi:ribosome maturation factor RimP